MGLGGREQTGSRHKDSKNHPVTSLMAGRASDSEYYLVSYFTLFLVFPTSLVKVYYPLVTVSLVVVMTWERRIGSSETKTGQGDCQTEKGKSQRQEF